MNKIEAIKILKYRHDISLPFEREALETLIPEFKESEDERIRKELVVELQCWEGIPETKRRQYLTYLEKQKEQKPADEQFPPLEGLDAIKAKYYDDGFKNGFDEGVASVKPAEWSEEDCIMQRALIDTLQGETTCFTTNDFISWIKFLRPSWKPSEEQMNALRRAVNKLAKSDVADSVRLSIMYDNLKKLM